VGTSTAAIVALATRYDDTNPAKEEEEFFVGIRKNVEWLGFTPSKITHSSDNFDELHALVSGCDVVAIAVLQCCDVFLPLFFFAVFFLRFSPTFAIFTHFCDFHPPISLTYCL
jgi:hypothetical protein